MDHYRTWFGPGFFYFYKNHPPPILLSSFKLNFLPLTFIISLLHHISFAFMAPKKDNAIFKGKGRFSSRLSVKERRRSPPFFLGLDTSLKVCPLISHRAFDLAMFLDVSMAFLSSDPSSEIGFFPLGSGLSSWPFWLEFR
ncbi:hypothetical protein AMTRI_Chr05g71090 [Amborella trichopoda]